MKNLRPNPPNLSVKRIGLTMLLADLGDTFDHRLPVSARW